MSFSYSNGKSTQIKREGQGNLFRIATPSSVLGPAAVGRSEEDKPSHAYYSK